MHVNKSDGGKQNTVGSLSRAASEVRGLRRPSAAASGENLRHSHFLFVQSVSVISACSAHSSLESKLCDVNIPNFTLESDLSAFTLRTQSF